MIDEVYDLQFKPIVRRRWKKHKCGFKENGDPFIWFEKDKMYIKFSDHKVCQHVCYCPICGKKIGRRYDEISALWDLWEIMGNKEVIEKCNVKNVYYQDR